MRKFQGNLKIEHRHQGYPNSVKGYRMKSPPSGGMGNFEVGMGILGGWNLRRSDFDHLNLFHN